MTDDERTPAGPESPDWPRLARELAEGRSVALLAGDDPRDAELLAALQRALRTPDPAAPTDAEVDDALRAVMARRALGPARGNPLALLWRRPALAAAAALLLVAGALVVRSRAHRGEPALAAAQPLHVATRTGQVDSLRLADGTRVILGPSSALDAAQGGRDVMLQGDAYFDVVHDAARPFVVHAAGAELRDVGTAFVVRTSAPAGVMVTVRDGAVSVQRAGLREQPLLLRAGDRGIVPASGSPSATHAAASDDDLAFTRGRLVLRDAPVSEVADAMRRWYGMEFRVTDTALARRRVTASFDREPAADVARVVAAALGGTVRFAGDTAFVAP